MLLFDVNVAVYAMRADLPEHQAYRDWFEAAATGPEPLGFSEFVLHSCLRLVTNHRIFNEPSTTAEALAFVDSIRAAPTAVRIQPGPRHWGIFSKLIIDNRLVGNDIPDAYLAALALEHGATWVTRDRGFARFRGLRTFTPSS